MVVYRCRVYIGKTMLEMEMLGRRDHERPYRIFREVVKEDMKKERDKARWKFC